MSSSDLTADAGVDVTMEELDELALDTALPTYAILARFRETAPSESAALEAVTQRLTDAGERFDQVALERQDDDGTWLVVARFVTVSVDAHTAVAGIHQDLHSAGLTPDEVWAERALS